MERPGLLGMGSVPRLARFAVGRPATRLAGNLLDRAREHNDRPKTPEIFGIQGL